MMKPTSSSQVFDSWDSLEGVSEVLTASLCSGDAKASWAHRNLAWLGERLPGIALAVMLAGVADWMADWIGHDLLHYEVNPITGVPLAILFGLLVCNTVGVPVIFHAGLKACTRQLQRLAIMMLGFRLSLGMVGRIGMEALPVVVVIIAAALWLVPRLGGRLGLSRRLSTLIAVGTSICGVSAIMAVAPTVRAEEEEVSYAVACVALFGLFAMLSYPYLAPALFGTDYAAAGTFFGTAIHDTAQVTGSALVFQQINHAPEVLNIATVVKILRNLSMVAVIPLMSALFGRGDQGTGERRLRFLQVVPLFVLGFLGMTVVRTVGDLTPRAFGLLEPDQWKGFLTLMSDGSAWFLTIVMAAVGLGTGLRRLQRLGLRPFLVGLSAALLVGGLSYLLIQLRSFLTST